MIKAMKTVSYLIILLGHPKSKMILKFILGIVLAGTILSDSSDIGYLQLY